MQTNRRRRAASNTASHGSDHRAGLDLDRQVEVGGGHLVGRADFRIKGTVGLVEAQSVLYHSSPMDSAHDQLRIAALLAAGFSVLTVWDYQAFHHPATVIETIRSFRDDLVAGTPPFHLECPES